MNMYEKARYCIIEEKELLDLQESGEEFEIWQIEKVISLIDENKLYAMFADDMSLGDIKEGDFIVFDRGSLEIFKLTREDIAHFRRMPKNSSEDAPE